MVIVIGADDDLGGCVVILKACIFRSGFLGVDVLSSEAGILGAGALGTGILVANNIVVRTLAVVVSKAGAGFLGAGVLGA